MPPENRFARYRENRFAKYREPAPASPQRNRDLFADDIGASLYDAGASFLSGLPQGAAAFAGQIGDVPEWTHAAMTYGARLARPNGRQLSEQEAANMTAPFADVATYAVRSAVMPYTPAPLANATQRAAPTSAQLNEAIESIPGVDYHEPETVAGEYARTLGQFAGGAVFPGSAVTRVARAVIPAVASEGGGQWAREHAPEHETLARILGGGGSAITLELAISRLGGAVSSTNAVRSRVRSELLDAGATPQEADAVLRVMGTRSPAAPDLAATQQIMSRLLTPEHLERMPTLSRQLGFDMEARGRALEQRFGDMSEGERTGDISQRLQQSDYETGEGRARTRMANFNDQRAPEIAANARRIAERELDPVSFPGSAGDAAAENLRGVYAEIRNLRRNLYDRADALAETSGQISPNVGAELMDRTIAMVKRLRLRHVPDHEQWVRAFDDLQRDIAAGNATWADVHAVRRQLTEAYAASNPAQRRIITAFKRELDGFRERFAPAEYNQAIANADRYSSEMSRMFGQSAEVEIGPNGDFVGNVDIAGRRMETILNQDIDARAVARMFLNQDGSPSPAGVALSRRLRSINDELIRTPGEDAPTMAPNRQHREPFSIRDGNRETVGSRGLAASEETPGRYGVEQPTGEMQAVREMVIDELVLSRLQARNAGDPIPAQVIRTRLNNFLRGEPGSRMADQLFTPSEIRALEDLRDYFGRLQTPSGRAASGTPQGIERSRQAAAAATANFLSRIAGVMDRYGTGGFAGRFVEGWQRGMEESFAAQQARQMTARPGPYRPQPPVDLTQRGNFSQRGNVLAATSLATILSSGSAFYVEHDGRRIGPLSRGEAEALTARINAAR